MSANQNDHNQGGMWAFLFCMAFTMVFFIYISFMTGGIDLKEVKPDQGGGAAPLAGQQAEGPKKIADINSVKQPWTVTPELVEHGHAIFKVNCVMCHGEKGLGDGPAGVALNPKPRNMVEGKWKKGGDTLALFKTVTAGLPPGMPPFAHLAPGDRWALVHFIHSITENKVKDDLAALEKAAPGLK